MILPMLKNVAVAAMNFISLHIPIHAFTTLIICLLLFFFRRFIFSCLIRSKNHFSCFPRFYAVATPLLIILSIFGGFYKFGAGDDKGQFGDSFGIINSLFTGLGFAGLIVTLIIQQWQISRQKQDSENAKDEESAARYDSTLHQLLELYKKSVESVVIKIDGEKFEGLDGISHAHYRMINTIRKNKSVILPRDVARRHGKGIATEKDWLLLHNLFERHRDIIQSTFNRQARLINSFTLLMHHLEERVPPNFREIRYARMLVQSQLTTLEMSYFFYLALASKSEENLRRLLRSSEMLVGFPSACRLEVHRMMYMYMWNYDPKTGITPSKSATRTPSTEWEIMDEYIDDDLVKP